MTDQRAYQWRSWLALAQTGWAVAHMPANLHTAAGAAATTVAAAAGAVAVVTAEAVVGEAATARAADAHPVVAAVAGESADFHHH